MTVLLITGAGASRNLGANGEPMPLMADWANALCGALDERHEGLSAACHLTPGMDGPTFEKHLGLLLRWQQVRELDERFEGLGGDVVGNPHARVVRARGIANERMELVMEVLNRTLYDQFGQSRIDDEKAAQAYKPLLEHLGRDVIVATTNYDRAVESALAHLDHEIDTGFRVLPHRTPTLEPGKLVGNRGEKTPVLHLHGAVGWYERNGAVGDHYADQPYNPSLGTPVVLYPDPDKDPTNDAIVSQLWAEFHEAVEIATAIVVIGHSLHDPALSRALAAAAAAKPVIISFHSENDADRIREEVPEAAQFELDFDPKGKLDISILRALNGFIDRQAASVNG